MTDTLPKFPALCRQWKIEKVRMDLALLESDGEDEVNDRIMDEGRAKMAEIEETILSTEPEGITDIDLIVMLRLAREITGDDQYTPEQEQRGEAMLELIDTTLLHRTSPADWQTRAVAS